MCRFPEHCSQLCLVKTFGEKWAANEPRAIVGSLQECGPPAASAVVPRSGAEANDIELWSLLAVSCACVCVCVCKEAFVPWKTCSDVTFVLSFLSSNHSPSLSSLSPSFLSHIHLSLSLPVPLSVSPPLSLSSPPLSCGVRIVN